jgi:hypothetical protein
MSQRPQMRVYGPEPDARAGMTGDRGDLDIRVVREQPQMFTTGITGGARDRDPYTHEALPPHLYARDRNIMHKWSQRNVSGVPNVEIGR